MAASSTTSCANSQPKRTKTNRTKLTRTSCLLAGALAVVACSGEKDSEDTEQSGPAPSFIPQLAAFESPERGPAPAQDAVVDASPDDVQAMIDAGQIRLIDIRTDEEVATGVIPGAEHIAMNQFDTAQLEKTDDRTVVLYCRSGRRSRLLGEKLATQTGQSVMHLEGGILAWQQAGKSVE